jgi:cobalt-zinc-cadmium efflux system protein
VMGDMLGSLAAIAAAIIILTTGWMPADPILSVLVAVLILWTAWSLMRDAAHVLLEGSPPALDRPAIIGDLVANVSGLREVHHMHLWSLDGTQTMATLHACLADGTDANLAVRAVKARLAAEFRITHATVEPEFAECADAGVERVH